MTSTFSGGSTYLNGLASVGFIFCADITALASGAGGWAAVGEEGVTSSVWELGSLEAAALRGVRGGGRLGST